MEELRKQAEILAEERRMARVKALEWSREVKLESDEERERKSKKPRKTKAENGSGDEASEPKKKKRGKIKKTSGPGDAEDQAVFSGDEEEKPAKKVTRNWLNFSDTTDVLFMIACGKETPYQG
jgi:RNA polymerase-associated protein CTR9